mmetsp:Transcript_5598/g.22047  ORF Transcript_5598/g.22047 Transcript_5598/m.22047 type:complete len:251 (-) Transcript_5598:202-954(-)
MIQTLHRGATHPRQPRQGQNHGDRAQRCAVHVIRGALLHSVPRGVYDARADVLVQEEEPRQEGRRYHASHLRPQRHHRHVGKSLREESPPDAFHRRRNGGRHRRDAKLAHGRQRAQDGHEQDAQRRSEVPNHLPQLRGSERALRHLGGGTAHEHVRKQSQVDRERRHWQVRAGSRHGARQCPTGLVHEVHGQQGVEDIVGELRAVPDQSGSAPGCQQEEKGRRPNANPAVHPDEGKGERAAELVQRHHEG